MRRFFYAWLVAVFFSQFALADQIVLNNGDRVTGTVIKSDGKDLVFKTDFAGEIKIHWTAIQGLNSATPLHVESKDGQCVMGPVRTEQGKLAILTDKGQVALPKDSIVVIRDQREESAYEETLHPGWEQGWTGGANVSFALTRGNSETKNLAVALTADRKTLHDHIGLYANSVYATNDALDDAPSITADTIQGGARYDHNVTSQLFAFGAGDFQTDALQLLDLRSVFSSGVGYHVVQSEHTTFNLLGGANYTHEKYEDFDRDLAGFTLGEELSTKVAAATALTQKMYFYPDTSETGEYRATFNFGAVTKINKWMGWQNAVSDVYVTNPPIGKRQNDILLTTGINFSFKH